MLIGGSGPDQLIGGAGVDRAQYSDAATAVLVDMEDMSLNTGDAAGDSFNGIEDLYGSNSNDQLRGDSQDNRIWGGSGHDVLLGRSGNDTLFGGDGDDRLEGGFGDDILVGDAGADRFNFKPNWANDRVSDFEDNVDELVFGNFGLVDAQDALSYATQVGSNVVFDFGGGDVLTVMNTTLTALADDILVY